MQTNYEHDPNHPLTTAFPYFPPEEQQWLNGELTQILNGILAMGPRVAQFEMEFAAELHFVDGSGPPRVWSWTR